MLPYERMRRKCNLLYCRTISLYLCTDLDLCDCVDTSTSYAMKLRKRVILKFGSNC